MRFPWNDECIELVKLYVSRKAGAGEIVHALKEMTGIYVSRNVVHGKVHRLGLRLSDRPSPGEGRRAKRQRKKIAVVAQAPASKPGRIAGSNTGFMASTPAVAKPPQPLPPEPELPPSDQRCSILDLNDMPENARRCRWIVGDTRKPLEAIYCGGPTDKRYGEDCPYCSVHAERSGRMRVKQAA